MSYYVYVDYRKDDGRAIYVGIGNLKRAEHDERNDKHVNVSEKHGIHREIRELPIEADVDGKFSDEDVAFVCHLERFLIKHLRTHVRYGGCNMTDGGEFIRGFRRSAESCEKMRIANLGRKHTPETKMKISANSGMKNPEVAARVGAALHGRTLSDETKAKMSDSCSMKRQDVAAKNAAARTGLRRSDEAKARMSLAARGNTNRRGKRSSAETREKNRIAARIQGAAKRLQKLVPELSYDEAKALVVTYSSEA